MNTIISAIQKLAQNQNLKKLLSKLRLLNLANKTYESLLRIDDLLTPYKSRARRPVNFLGQKFVPLEKWTYARDLYSVNKSQSETIPAWQCSGCHNHNEFDKPQVSIISSIYRSDEYLPNFLEIIHNQSIFPQLEIAIDSVMPSTLERQLLEQFQNNHENVNIVFHNDKRTIYECWNSAISRTRAPFITNMNVDDVRSRLSIEKQHVAISSTLADVVFQNVYLSLLANADWELIKFMDQVLHMPEVSSSTLISGVNSPHNAPMWRREVHDLIGFFDTKYLSAADHDFWIRCAQAGLNFHKMEEMTVAYYLNPTGMSTKRKSPGHMEGAAIIEKYSKSQ